jgi:ABC-2 type transport system permease protein
MFTKKMLVVFAWEFSQKVRSKGFLFSMIFMPAVIIGFTLIPTYLADSGSDRPWTVAVADETGLAAEELSIRISEEIKQLNEPNSIRLIPIIASNSDSGMILGRQLAEKGIVEGYLTLDERSILDRHVRVFVSGGSYMGKFRILENAIQKLILERHAVKLGLKTEQIRNIAEVSRIRMIQMNSDDTEMIQKYLTGIILVMMLFFAIFNSGGSFMRGISEEKNNRVIEILASSVNPKELMTGKILGLGFVGLLQIAVWGLLGAVFGGKTLSFVSPLFIVYFITYFVFGFLLFAGIFAAIGSVLSTEQDIQPVQAVLSVIGILPVALAILVLQEPDSLLVSILSYIPLLTPTLMILRLVISSPTIFEIIGTMLMLLLSLILTLRLAGKVFSVALLMHGKKPTLSEMVRWARTW